MAIKYSEPNAPLKKVDEKGNIEYIYPQTLASQVIMNERGERLNTILNENLLWLGDTGDEGVESIDADMLGGIPANDYATKEYIDQLLGGIENGTY